MSPDRRIIKKMDGQIQDLGIDEIWYGIEDGVYGPLRDAMIPVVMEIRDTTAIWREVNA